MSKSLEIYSERKEGIPFLPIVPLMEHIFVLKFLVFTQNLAVWFQCRFISLPLLLSSKYILVWKSVNTVFY